MQPPPRTTVANQSFDPEGNQRTVLNVFKDEYQVNPKLIQDITGLERQRINEALGSLQDAGWIEKRCRGLYRLVYNGECYVVQDIRCKGESVDV